jgi:23S rRNA (adenine2503-C2)-methyltransferase
MKIDIKSMLPTELGEYFTSIGEQQYRAKQVFSWLHKGVRDFEDMTNISSDLRCRLDGVFFISSPEIVVKQESKPDGTVKYLWRLKDEEAIESVFMEYRHGSSVCISTQVGCGMGCVFCASSIGGLVRNLNASEMLDQVLFTQLDTGKRISNVVLMGIGEPLDNFDNVKRFIDIIYHPYGMNIGARHMTLSTCGIVENIDKLAEHGVQLTLAVSLHAPDDETRTHLIPSNRNVGVRNLLDACERFFTITGRRVTYEYAMIDGLNDSPEQAEKLSELLKNTSSHLNLIKLSDIRENALRASSSKSVDEFTKILTRNKINFTFRRNLGADIEASCGQLRRVDPKSVLGRQ